MRIAADLANKIFDPDERVRTAVCRLFGDLPYETLITHVHAKHLRSVGDRIMDKKVSCSVYYARSKLIKDDYAEHRSRRGSDHSW
jgi:sister-chromatid-cohesion protein PDS5